MSDLAFNEDFGMLADAKPHRYISALHGATRLLTISAQTPWIRPIIPYIPIDRQSRIDGREFGAISRGTYDRRRARKVHEPDMFEYITASEKGERPLTEAEAIADTSLLIAAGAVSTALTITFIFSELCRNRSQIEKLQAEIDNCWDGKSPLEVGSLSTSS
jgi:cytochrome P450